MTLLWNLDDKFGHPLLDDNLRQPNENGVTPGWQLLDIFYQNFCKQQSQEKKVLYQLLYVLICSWWSSMLVSNGFIRRRTRHLAGKITRDQGSVPRCRLCNVLLWEMMQRKLFNLFKQQVCRIYNARTDSLNAAHEKSLWGQTMAATFYSTMKHHCPFESFWWLQSFQSILYKPFRFCNYNRF